MNTKLRRILLLLLLHLFSHYSAVHAFTSVKIFHHRQQQQQQKPQLYSRRSSNRRRDSIALPILLLPFERQYHSSFSHSVVISSNSRHHKKTDRIPRTMIGTSTTLSSSVSSNLDTPNRGIVRFITNPMCPFAQKVWLALECSQTEYQMGVISLYGTNGKPDWFWKLNPKGTVPVLVVQEKRRKDAEQEDENNMKIYPDSDHILDQLYEQQNNPKQAWEYQVSLIPPVVKIEREDDIVLQMIKEWRDLINQELIPIGKQYVLNTNQKKNEKMFIELLQRMNDRVIQTKTTIDSFDSTTVTSTNTNTTKYLLSPYYHQPTIADCHAFPFVWRLYTQYGNLLKQHAPLVTEWIDFCLKQSTFQTTISSSWWWWW
jgi:glutathione S-transferase